MRWICNYRFISKQNILEMFHTIWVLFLIIIHHNGLASCCRQEFLTERKGLRCVNPDFNITLRTPGDRHDGITDCIRRQNCWAINFNKLDSSYVLSGKPCKWHESNENYDVVFLGTPEICLRWVPSINQSLESVVSAQPCHLPGRYVTCYVGRLISPPHILPGRYIGVGGVVSVLNGNWMGVGNVEVLRIHPGCQVKWVPFAAGSVIPPAAVVGGHRAGTTGSTLYVISGMVGQMPVVGYYDARSERGYIRYGQTYTLERMEILVVIWCMMMSIPWFC